MITGLDIRNYRKAVGLDQRDFASRLGLTQSAVSLVEIGKQPVSEELLTKIMDAFDQASVKPPFSEFRRTLEQQLAQGQAALSTPQGRFLTLVAWKWEPGFDLSRPVRAESAAGMVSVPYSEEPAIAFRMSQSNEMWTEGEILVFRRCARDDLKQNDLCLAQVKAARGSHTKTVIARAHVGRATRGRAVHLEPLSPAGPVVQANESVVAYLRVVYRAKEIA